jgi:hypothetical protein
MTSAGRRGRSALRLAIGCIRAGVESPRETLVRLMIVAAGLPEPVVNATVRDGIDVERTRELEAEGWIVIRVVASDLRGGGRTLVELVERHLRSRGWPGNLPRRPSWASIL